MQTFTSLSNASSSCKRVRTCWLNACFQPTPTWLRDIQRCFSKSNPRAIHEAQALAVDVSPSKHLEGVPDREIERCWDIPHTTFQWLKKRRGTPDALGSVPITSLQRVGIIGEPVSAPERTDSAILTDHESRIAVLEVFMSPLQRQAHFTSAPERISTSAPQNALARTSPPVWVNCGTHLAADMVEAIDAYAAQHRLEKRQVLDLALRMFCAAVRKAVHDA